MQPGSTVAFVLRNSAEYVGLILAVARLGARYVPLLSNFDGTDVRRALELACPQLLVTDGHRAVDAADVPSVPLAELARSAPIDPRTRQPDPAAEFRMLWTSGSTGFPKAMTWRQDKFVRERHRWIRDTGIQEDDVFFCRHSLDVAHATDLHVFAALLSGAELVLADPGSAPGRLLTQLEQVRATVTSALPQHYADLAEAARARTGRVDLSRLRRPLCGGAYLSPEEVRAGEQALGVRIRQIYGSTEFGLALGNMTDTVQDRAGMVAVEGVGVRVEPLYDADPGIGELVLVSDCTSEGYLGSPEANARTFRGTEFWTGDIARRSPDGSYRILGRVTEALAASGGPLPAPLLEAELTLLPEVGTAVCLAVHPGGYRNDVFVLLQTDDESRQPQALAAVAAVLTAHGLNGTTRFVTELPRTPVGKIDKALLRREWQLDGAR